MKSETLIEKKDVAKAALSFSFGLVSTTIGFFLGLYFNTKIANGKELETFSNIKKGIMAEIRQNQKTLDSSFRMYIETAIFNELSTFTSSQQLTNAVFLKHADADLLVALQNYIRKCDLCNKQKTQLKDFRIADKESKWEAGLQMGLENTTETVDKSMKELLLKLNSR